MDDDRVVSLDEAFGRFDDHWSPKVIATINDMELKLAKVQGEFVWHRHEDTDEFFLVWSGRLTILVRDAEPVHLEPGDFHVVPRGVEHCPVAEDECRILLLEPAGVVNTGDANPSDLTAEEEWI